MVSYAVSMMTSMLGSNSLSWRRTSVPGIPAMRMSQTTTSTGLFRASSSAVSPSLASRMLYSSLKMILTDWRGPSSSSTTNSVGFCALVEFLLEVISDGEGDGMTVKTITPICQRVITNAASRAVGKLISQVPVKAACALADAEAEDVAV